MLQIFLGFMSSGLFSTYFNRLVSVFLHKNTVPYQIFKLASCRYVYFNIFA